MTIHVVQAGESLNAIGRTYGVSPGLIARYNGLLPPYALAVGQSLLILFPTATYTVRQGDTLNSIARQTGTTPLELLQNNPNLGGVDLLYPGQVLVLGFQQQRRRSIQVSGYAYPFVNRSVLRAILPYATFLAPFTYGITSGGGLVLLEDQALIALALEYQVLPLMHLSTLTESGSFSSERAAAILRSPELQAALADQVVAVMDLRGYRGLDVDFEFLSGEYAAAYAEFLGLLRQRVNAMGEELITALAPKTSADQPGTLYEGHNYRLVGENSDAVLLMTYEWGYTYGPPMAVAPLPSVRRVLEYAVTEIPPEKIFMGMPNYGYDWTLPYVSGTSRAQSISNETAVALAVRHGAEIRFDETAATPWFTYTENDQIHEVWFEDVRSVLAKTELMEEFGFRGLGYWNFMRPFTQNWSLLNALYTLEKLE